MIWFFAPESALLLNPPRIFFGALNNCNITSDAALPRVRALATKNELRWKLFQLAASRPGMSVSFMPPRVWRRLTFIERMNA
jgi:hypothetical protein